jgi:hypothetical protein
MDKKADKSKFKLKQQAYVAQEQLVTQKQNQIDDLTRNLSELKRDLDRKDDDIRNLKQTNESLKGRLDEAVKQVEEKESVIRFLNQDINKQKAEQMRRPILPNPSNENIMPITSGLTTSSEFAKPFNMTSNNYPTTNIGHREFSNTMNNQEMILPFTNFGGYGEGTKEIDNRYKTIDSSI